ncbi:U-box domain-containing protein 35-like [Nicotiana tomentosiformis]|uniref:RING-type E3 ubiquitin transferase n=1 Tax=Nicotiana tabacum TaxID=4097 RepID=A0A1S4BL09_TOBAC|nr:PREDICTED: U-box domain-containing protein 35-like [Nicotiana tabacum]
MPAFNYIRSPSRIKRALSWKETFITEEEWQSMEENDISKTEGQGTVQSPTSSVVAIAISGNKNSKYVVKWALDKFVPEGETRFMLLHVRPEITAVPTPMGNLIPIAQVREDVADAFRKEVELQASEKLLPYKTMFIRRKVQVGVVQIESNDVVNAIAGVVSKCSINKLVIGTSTPGLFSRGRNLSASISETAPTFCTVYAVSKGKLSSVRPSSYENNGAVIDDSSDTSSSSNNSTGQSFSSQGERTDHSSTSPASYSHLYSPTRKLQRYQSKSPTHHALQTLLHKRTNIGETIQSRTSSIDIGEAFQALSIKNNTKRANLNEVIHPRAMTIATGEAEDDKSCYFSSSGITDPNSLNSSFKKAKLDNQQWSTSQSSNSDAPTDSSSGSQVNINYDLEKLRIELKHIQGMYAIAQTEAIDASRKLNEFQKLRVDEANKLMEINLKEEEAKEFAEQEKLKCEAAKKEADYAMECAEREVEKRRAAESIANREARAKEKLEKSLILPLHHYQKFTWEEIMTASASFSEDLKIGMGSYGMVYKCYLHHTTAAVKVLHSTEAHRTKQFQQELEILSTIHHPHLLILLGACPERGCLVYEYMENGSLEDRLIRKNKTPPLAWFDRVRIAWEVASALVFLHYTKPKPIIHRDLKPANILLDHNLVSKIGDVGLSTMVHSDSSSAMTAYKDTSPVGTLCYIDPEYQRTGLVSTKSDVYAFGMVILQLLTAKRAIALAHMVEMAIEDNNLVELLDQEAGEWPIEETKELAVLAIKCTELRRRDRPDLKDEVLPALERLKEVADRARDLIYILSPSPSHFKCPILKEVMHDPCVAADGYTYDRKAIESWLKDNDHSPVTNSPLPHKQLLANYTLLSAIKEWKSGKH